MTGRREISFPPDLNSLNSEHFCHLWLCFEFPVLGKAEASAYLLVTTSKASVKGKDFKIVGWCCCCWAHLHDFLILIICICCCCCCCWVYFEFPDIDHFQSSILVSFSSLLLRPSFSTTEPQKLPAGKKNWNCFSGKKNWKDRMFCNEAKVWLVRQEKRSVRCWKRCW